MGALLLTLLGCNRSPRFEVPFKYEHRTRLEHDLAGNLTGATTTITAQPATDPNGDEVSYLWSLDPASAGTLAGDGLTATWRRVLEHGRPQPGVAVLTATDGRGGKAAARFEFK
jgi:hypothetical protein